MKRVLIALLVSMALAAPIALQAQTAKAPAKAGAAAPAKGPAAYKAPRNAFGQPDIGGFWTNASITGESRPAGVTSAVYSEADVRRLEGEVQDEITYGNRVTDPNAPTYPKGGQKSDSNRPQFQAAGGGVGGYNRGWIDPGSAVMRVNGEPRSSFLTTPNGRPPARKTAAAAQARGLNALGGEGDDAPGRGAGRGGGGGAPAATPGAGRGGGQQAAAGGGGRGGGGGLGGGNRADPEQWPLGERCIISFGRNGGPPMTNNGFYNNNYQFVQGRDTIAIWVEMVHDVRTIRMNAKHRTDNVRPWFGDSIGHWEGETLVVETTHIPQAQAYSGSWQNLTVTERFRRVSPTRLFYQYSIHDPDAWDADWGGEYEFDHLPQGQHVYEYACHEGNYAMENMLAGARADEEAARQRAAATPPGRGG
jgi:hypothetical protein